MDIIELFFRAEIARHDRLIGDDDHLYFMLVEKGDGLSRVF